MSATSHNICPACYHRASGIPFNDITQTGHLNNGEDLLDTTVEESLAEYYENYIDNGHIVFHYDGAECQACGYQIPEFTLRHPIPDPSRPDNSSDDDEAAETPNEPHLADMLQQCLDGMEPIITRLTTSGPSPEWSEDKDNLLAMSTGAVVLMARAWIAMEHAAAEARQAGIDVLAKHGIDYPPKPTETP